jgi:NADH-quinone oxidoreductase subunit L
MLFLIPAFPFLGFLLNAALGRRLNKTQSAAVGVGSMIASFAVSLVAVFTLLGLDAEARAIVQRGFNWITSGELVADLTLRLDPLSAVMILVVTGVGLLIHVYSTSYMHDERAPEFARYFAYLNLFAAFMLVLVLGANFLVMFVGWEGVGLASYLLIGFWYTKKSATDAGKKAFIVNRIGDAGFVLGVLALFARFGTLDFHELARALTALRPETGFGPLSVASLLLFVGATGKSAQIPLYVWLPDAMEGPTPVSALIHAATMVTAGVYMIGRTAVLFSHTPATLAVVAVVGVVTALMAATIALVQTDIKRVLAYSTVSQLGYMFLAMGVGAFGAGIFHLYTHAFFKALLFLGAGAVIHALSGEQDLRRMGGLRRDLPLTYWTFLAGALAIAGVPGLAGFFSKDEILFRTYAGGHVTLWGVGLVTSLLTAVYMFRLVFMAFHGGPRLADRTAVHDAPRPMAIALVALAVGSILAGYLGLPHVLGGSNRLDTFLEPSFVADVTLASARTGEPAGIVGPRPASAEQTRAERTRAVPAIEETPGLELGLMAVSTVIALGGIGLAVFLFLKEPRAADPGGERLGFVRRLLVNKYYVDEIYDLMIVRPIRAVAELGLWKGIDVRLIDGALDGLGSGFSALGGVVRRVQTGSVRTYAASLLLGVVLIIGYYLWR